jgi:hypothetical protein
MPPRCNREVDYVGNRDPYYHAVVKGNSDLLIVNNYDLYYRIWHRLLQRHIKCRLSRPSQISKTGRFPVPVVEQDVLVQVLVYRGWP